MSAKNRNPRDPKPEPNPTTPVDGVDAELAAAEKAHAKAQRDAAAKAKREAEAKAKREAEAKAKREAEAAAADGDDTDAELAAAEQAHAKALEEANAVKRARIAALNAATAALKSGLPSIAAPAAAPAAASRGDGGAKGGKPSQRGDGGAKGGKPSQQGASQGTKQHGKPSKAAPAAASRGDGGKQSSDGAASQALWQQTRLAERQEAAANAEAAAAMAKLALLTASGSSNRSKSCPKGAECTRKCGLFHTPEELAAKSRRFAEYAARTPCNPATCKATEGKTCLFKDCAAAAAATEAEESD